MKDPTGTVVYPERRDARIAELNAKLAAEKAEKTEAREKKIRKQKPATMTLSGPEKALFDHAAKAARELKRAHRAYYDTDLRGFRATVKKAHGRVFRLKPGPKPEARIAAAARERAQGASWESLYPKYIDFYWQMPESTRALAEEGFRKKVNTYLQRHRRLRRTTPPGRLPTN
jgi:hypothetical protein